MITDRSWKQDNSGEGCEQLLDWIYLEESKIFPDGLSVEGCNRWVAPLCKQEKVQIEHQGKGNKG